LQSFGCLRDDVVEHHVLAVSVFVQRVKRFVGFSSDVEWLAQEIISPPLPNAGRVDFTFSPFHLTN
jgi:hypothetical protein